VNVVSRDASVSVVSGGAFAELAGGPEHDASARAANAPRSFVDAGGIVEGVAPRDASGVEATMNFS
jgi:hypothetical protein